MTKKMRDLQEQIKKHVDAAEAYMNAENPDAEAAAKELDKADALQKQFDVEARLEEIGKAAVPAEPQQTKSEVSGWRVMAKLLRGAPLTDDELNAVDIDDRQKALISGANAVSGENYLCPEDVALEINELRKQYASAREIVSVEPTFALSGSVNFEGGAPAGLTAFTDGGTIAEETNPLFVRKPWAIKWFGKIIYVSQILEGAERASLIGYLNRWFVRSAILTENAKIFETLKTGYNSGTPKALEGWDALRSSYNVDLDPAAKVNGRIVTNQSGFDSLAKAVDGNGRPMMQPDITQPTRQLFNGVEVTVFSNAMLPNIDATHFPVIYGDTKAGALMKVYQNMLLAASEHAEFKKAQLAIRVMEGFDVISTDTSAYIYGSLVDKPATKGGTSSKS